MTTLTSKLPTNDRPLIKDPALVAALDKLLAPLSGKALERAQDAVRRVARSAVQGTFSTIVETYRKAIRGAVGDKEATDG